ncbi:hypothetical protein FSP39_001360 [Pinctada imbricata]|uniref:Uncharacterized protein n=1 Tax=Pinctada imbricata TaxID=66713 RepID=A0AA89BUJ6_PINIB|nr:hypothetical protein FSP39_001360 [Pinctada imbricata]
MRSYETPTFNSTRIQRAYRINNIEQHRLQGKLNLIEKEKVHSIRVTNQDIRLISLTLDYINTCSGHSPEGLAPESEEEYVKKDDGPCFMYGERVVSRKRRRFKRPQSAAEQSNRQSESDATSILSGLPSSIRPQSSPTRRATFVTTLREPEVDAESVFSEKESVSTSTTSWMSDTSKLTKKLIKANVGIRARESLHEKPTRRVRSHSLVNGQRKLMPLDGSAGLESYDRTSRRSSSALGRNAGLSEIMNQRRPTLTASAWKSHLNKQSRSDGVPMTIAAKRQHVMDRKLQINDVRREFVDSKVKSFMDKIN